jgi:hypothetical protein
MYRNVGLVGFMVLSATFNNISVISWWSALLVEEIRVLGEDLPQFTDKLYHIMCIETYNIFDK